MGKLISIIETSRRLGLTEQSVRDWIKKGYISVREVGRARYIDEDTILALQDTIEDIKRQQLKLEALRNEIKGEYDYMRYQHDDEKNRRRYLNMMTGAAFRSGFFGVVVHLLQVYGELSEKEAKVLTDYLNGITLEAIAVSFGLTRERVRQIVEKAIRRSKNISQIEDRLNQIRDLQADNEAMKRVIEGLKNKLGKYETQEAVETEQDEGKRRQTIIENDEICRLLATKLVDCDLSVRALNCLMQGAAKNTFSFDKDDDRDQYIVPPCRTVGDLCRMTQNDYLKIRNAGKKTLRELDDFLHSIGLDWGMDVDKVYEERINLFYKQ